MKTRELLRKVAAWVDMTRGFESFDGKRLRKLADRLDKEIERAKFHATHNPNGAGPETLAALHRIDVILEPDENGILHCSPDCEASGNEQHLEDCPVFVHLSEFSPKKKAGA